MYIQIDIHGDLSLQEVDDFKQFSIIDLTKNTNRTLLNQIGHSEKDDHYWIKAESVIALCPRSNDSTWADKFWAMLKAAEPYGYADMESKLVKAHIEENT